MTKQSIILKPEVFGDDYLSPSLGEQDALVEQLAQSFRDVRSGPLPRYLLTGPTGCGKTAVGRAVLRELGKSDEVATAEINCWQARSPFAVLDALTADLRLLHAEAHSTTRKRERLQRRLRDKRLILLLDEIARPPPKARNAILFELCSLPNTGLIVTSQYPFLLTSLEPPVRSRFQPDELKLASPTVDQLTPMVHQRAKAGLAPKSYTPELLQQIANAAHGDARAATSSLLLAARNAERERSPQIRVDHLPGSVPSQVAEPKQAAWLTPHHQLLIQLTRKRGAISSADLYAAYVAAARKQELPSVALRTYREYVSSLIHAGLLTVDPKRTRGNRRVLRSAPDSGANAGAMPLSASRRRPRKSSA